MTRLLLPSLKDARQRIILIETWDKLKNKYEPVSVLSMVKLDKQFRELTLKKGQDPEIWITELEDIPVRLDDMGSSIPENQFMIHVLNNLPEDYNLIGKENRR